MKYGGTMNLMKYLYKHTTLIKSLEFLVSISQENLIRCSHSTVVGGLWTASGGGGWDGDRQSATIIKLSSQ